MRSWLASLAFGLIGAITTPALAEPDEAAKLVARELMAKGRQQREAKDFRGALESFSKAHAIMHVPTTLVEAARARVDAGLWLEALELLRELVDEPARTGEPAPFAPARAEAQKLGQSLDARIPTLRIDLSGSPRSDATKLWVDGVLRPDCTSSCRLNPGTHVISARAPTAQAEEQVRIAEGESPSLELVFSPDAALTAAALQRPYRSPAATPPPSNDGLFARAPTATWVAGGVAVLGVATGSVLGLGAVSQRDDLRRECAPNCRQDEVDGVRRRAVFANLSFGVGAAAAAVAVMTYVLSPDGSAQPRDARSARHVEVAAAPDPTTRGGYVSLRAAF